MQEIARLKDISPPFVEDRGFVKTRLMYQIALFKYFNKENNFDFFEASEDIPVSLRDIYVPLRLDKKDVGTINTSEDVEDIEGNEVAYFLREHQLLALSGLAGSGKSTLSKYLASSLSEQATNNEHFLMGRKLVLPIVLRELDFSAITSLNDLFLQWTKLFRETISYHFEKDFLDYYIENNWAIIIFDGLDELEQETSQKLTEWIIEYSSSLLVKDELQKTHIIITARPTGFSAIEKQLNQSSFKKLYIQPFNQTNRNF